jgi:Protein of unknown function (DUF2384)
VERVVKDRQTQRRLIYRIVPETTYKRRRDLLKLEESEHTERLARVIATAEYVWDNEEESRRFLTTPNPALGGLRPIDTAYTELGARRWKRAAMANLLWSPALGGHFRLTGSLTGAIPFSMGPARCCSVGAGTRPGGA